ncbi:MAG: efflux RND transporter periplasmic adaptor subunit [Candidatus Rokubacteria bacterium]|nr:efflux RND transporter periplasmic adaptor subunit [Candidatus Rokubacteria bacterium]
MRRRLLTLFVIVVLAVGVTAAWFYAQGRGAIPRYRFAKVEKGPLTATVSATGNLNAVITVQVGSQVSGQINQLLADFNSQVKKGQLIARIDPDSFEAKVNQAKADLENAQAAVLNQTANVERARADVENARAALASAQAQTAKAQVALLDAKRDFDRKSELLKKELIAQSDMDTSQATRDSAAAQLESARHQEQALASQIRSAEAQLKVAEAQLKAAQAQVRLKKAALDQAQVDLDHTYIRAPVDGVVVSRNVDVGQTVAASLQAPTLFTIAQDLTQMQVDTNVDEADVGRIGLGQPATFTVDSFPGRTFSGEVVQIRKAPQVVQNVVTYDVVVSAQNKELKLLPGMTANVRIVVDQKPSVLKVPNAALRFRPQGVEPDGAPRGGGGQPASPRGGLQGRVWILGPDGKPKPLSVQLGISDGSFTEILDAALAEGQEVIVGATERPASQPAGGGAPRIRF